MSIERRAQERFSLNLQARITYRHTTEQSPVVDTVTANISSGGAFLQSAHNFPMAAKINIEFYVHIDDLQKLKFILSVENLKQLTGTYLWVNTRGVVIRKEENGVAIIFDTDYQFSPMRSTSANTG